MSVEPFPRSAHWLKHCITDGPKKKPLAILANVLIALQMDLAIRDAFAFDEMAQCVMLMHPIGEPLAEGTKPRPVADADIDDLQDWLQHNGFKRIGRDDVHHAVASHARKQAYHPVRGYLENQSGMVIGDSTSGLPRNSAPSLRRTPKQLARCS